LAEHVAQTQVAHQRYEQEQSTDVRPKRTRCQAQEADIGHRFGYGPDGGWSFVVTASRQTSEALLAEQEGQGVDTDGMTGGGQVALDVVDGQVLLPHGDGAFADPIAHRRGAGAVRNGLEESSTEVWIMAEAMAEDAKGTCGIVEASGDLRGRRFVEEVGPQSLILALAWHLGSAKEAGSLEIR
jgi:hypothetical protein